MYEHSGAVVAVGAASVGGNATMQPATVHHLRLLSWNIQAGVSSAAYRHYVTHSWKHVLPHAGRQRTLDRIAQALTGFDIVGLQESDAGSLRTGFVNQTEYLAARAGFTFWYDQTNRRVGTISRHGNGMLSRVRPRHVQEYPLPGLPGRGALAARYGGDDGFSLFIIHLALGRRGRLRQLRFLRELVGECRRAVVMGDLNCAPGSGDLDVLLEGTSLQAPERSLRTFPSWQPRRHIDHILVSGDIRVHRSFVPAWYCSDHLPIAMEVSMPGSLLASGSAE